MSGTWRNYNLKQKNHIKFLINIFVRVLKKLQSIVSHYKNYIVTCNEADMIKIYENFYNVNVTHQIAKTCLIRNIISSLATPLLTNKR